VLAGDGAAVDRLAEEALVPLFRFCFYRLGGDRYRCEEVVQETLIRAIGEMHRYDPARSDNDIFPWLAGLARNEIQRSLAQHRAGADLVELWQRMDEEMRRIFAGLNGQPLADELLERDETRQMVGATMSQLPAKYRDALEAKYLHGRSVRDIAAGLRETEKAIESRLTRARQAFRETFTALAKQLDIDVPIATRVR
jgi:RNA polymerase sigma-70 factor (ECF subfamily)